jgi:hypothetical protein
MEREPRSDPRDRLVRPNWQDREVCCLPKPRLRNSFRVLLLIGATFGLLGIGGCSGGFQGSLPVAPTIVGPANQTVQAGSTATFTVTAGGSGPLAYQWYKDGVAISGATSSTYTTPNTVAGDDGSVFTVVVSSPAGSLKSGPATLTVHSPAPLAKSIVPSSATPPFNAAVNLIPTFSGGTAVIGSMGVGSSDIATAAVSGSSYPTPALTSAKTYTLTVTDAKGNVVSTTCLVTPTSVTITPISPANQTVAPGQTSYSATASGGVTNGLTWTASAGSFSGNVWTPPAVVGTYTITATSVDEPSVFVTTTATVSGPAILTQPSSQRVCTGAGILLSVSANYAASYQWNFNGTAIPGATNASYTVSGAAAANAGNYSVTVTNPIGSVTSAVAVVVVGSTITSNPTSLSIRPTQTALFAVSVQGLSPLAYQWYQIPAGGSTGVAIPGATSNLYTTPGVDMTYNGAKYYATATDSCMGTPLTSGQATLTVSAGNASPTITMQPVGVNVTAGGTTSFSVTATGTPALSYQWFRVPAGQTTGTAIAGATAATYNVPASATATTNDQDQYYVVVSNPYGQAISQRATLAVGAGILLQITGQPVTQYVDEGTPATYQVTAVSSSPLSYQWFEANPGSSTFTAIAGATGATYTVDPTVSTQTGSIFYVVVSNGTTASVTSDSAGLFVGPLAQVPNLCDSSWSALGSAVAQSGCSFRLTTSINNQHGEIVWPTLISTSDIQLSFTVTLSNPSAIPADGFAVVLGDPSLGATPTSLGATGMGLAAKGIPGLVFAFDTYHNAGDPAVPYLGVGRGESALWENPWFNVNTAIPTLVAGGMTISHTYTVSLVQGSMTITLDGVEVVSGSVAPPPVAYLYVTSSTGGSWETAIISNVSATISVPSN